MKTILFIIMLVMLQGCAEHSDDIYSKVSEVQDLTASGTWATIERVEVPISIEVVDKFKVNISEETIAKNSAEDLKNALSAIEFILVYYSKVSSINTCNGGSLYYTRDKALEALLRKMCKHFIEEVNDGQY